MELDLVIARAPARTAHRARSMQTTRQSNWRLKSALTLSLMASVGWGFVLGVALVRINTLFLPIGMVLVGLPVAFLGSAITSAAFHRMLPSWHRVARLLVVLLAVAVAVPLGLAWGLFEQQLDPMQLVSATGALIWDAEWLAAILGLVGGTWTGWTRPFLEPLGSAASAVLGPPLRLVSFIWSIPGRVVEAIAQFFENVGHGFLWLPGLLLQLFWTLPTRAVSALIDLIAQLGQAGAEQMGHASRFLGARYRDVRGRRASTTRPDPPGNGSTGRQRRTPSPRSARRFRAPTRRRSIPENGPRVLSVVEDRCPYCFDVVKRNDPRGVRVCEVCGTPHHADCWAITGKCQVPHLNTQ